MTALWTAADAAAATGGSSVTEWTATGVSIDTRSLAVGDLFVALHGPNHDGHDFVATALQRGAAAAMVDRAIPQLPASSPLLVVADTLAALAALGAAGRNRSQARIVAVTGSVGKTGTKEALRLALASSGPTYASAGGLNNHWGAPLSLARLPRDACYGVFELGMNHPGEIANLTRLVRPHVAVITTVEPVHLGFFPSVEAIADAKAEIFLGLEPGGFAILNRDNAHYARLAAAAKRAGAAEILDFGAHPEAAARLVDYVLDSRGSTVEATVCGTAIRFLVPVPGRHWVMNTLAVLAAARAAGAAVDRAAEALAELQPPPGRGRRDELAWRGGTLTVIDESYNASPPSMRAALAVLAATEPGTGARRVAVLGDMLELGDASERLHRELAEPVAAAEVSRVFLIGEAIAALNEVLPEGKRGGLWRSPEEAMPALLRFLKPGDIVTVKGSRGVRVSRIVQLLRAQSAGLESYPPELCSSESCPPESCRPET
jgi:UDP-N-acetylmuramoyl-tripeptide--D-alanyl-D-alanine ligase